MNNDQLINLIQTLFVALGSYLAAKGIGDKATWEALGGLVVAFVTWVATHKWNSTPATAPTAADATTPTTTNGSGGIGGATRLLFLFLLPAMILWIVTGCTTNQQQIAVNTLATLEQSATAAVDSYDTLVIQGTVPTNNVPTVAKAYNDFQAAFVVALDGVQYNTNAVAPPALAVEAQDLINLITTVETNR